MSVEEAYNSWASQYDTNQNKTRDLEAIALRMSLSGYLFKSCLEIGCGTGKNTAWLVERAEQVVAVDFSEEMLLKAKAKIQSNNIKFIRADISEDWDFNSKGERYDLISFSFVLEHIAHLDPIFEKASQF